MTYNKIAFIFSAVLLFATSCENVDFGDLNQNPNEPSNPVLGSLMANTLGSISGYVGATTSNMYVQYLSNGQYPEESQYQTLNWDFSGWYSTLSDLQKIIDLNTDESTRASAAQGNASNENQIAVATILRAFYFHTMTDRWGMLPYTEALNGLEIQYPKFDSQQAIYQGLFDELDMAIGMIEPGAGPNGDYLFEGDMSRWETFAQTLKMVMALRLSAADPTLGSQMFNEALGHEIMSNSENFYYPFLAEENNDNPWEDRFLAPNFRRDYMVSDVFVNALIGSGTDVAPEDPRLEQMAEPAFNSGTFVGAFYGEANDATDDYSFITQDIIYNQTAPLYIFTYSEVLFARAEAAHLGWTNEDASALYEDAIEASMEQWGVAEADAAAYIAANPYTGPDDIGYEKWVSLFLQGYESWAEWRRMKAMGYEMPLDPPAEMLSNATGIPDRQAYAATASALNEENYNAAISAQGADALNTVLWIFE
ncbi:SusD/RagB family nutrient-binding outer membrane lipoprotein [Aegicerativicinus sediminis]|uniref:SusD/RagB family nutrient-binding outer membrane lipoprotein n=1 Tax=Aegicerativicinus sediminis TaxID=2893202 RepID=UPI001E37DDA7|nr:SusD/RagB family nutrient-binding outer membrane lipoprotein [Aegicerativicinus sediminis]